MKKLISIALVMLMMLFVTIPVFAEESPENPGEEYDITVKDTNGGTATYKTDSDGNVVLIAKEEEGHEFHVWRIEGDYTIVSGTQRSKVLTIVPDSDIEARALFDSDFYCEANATTGGTVTYQWNKDGTLTLTAEPFTGHVFKNWKIFGDYIVVEGTMKTQIIILNPSSDIKAIAYFDDYKEIIEPSDDDVSPDTGYAVAPAICVALVSMFGAAYCFKRSKEN